MCNRSIGVATAVAYIPLILIVVTLIGRSAGGREIRPSEHGLQYQSEPPAGEKTPEMTTFFGGSSSSSTSANVALPKAMNSSDPSWWGGYSGEGKRKGHDHVKEVLLVASLVCGITGVVFLVATAFIFIVRFKRHRSSDK